MTADSTSAVDERCLSSAPQLSAYALDEMRFQVISILKVPPITTTLKLGDVIIMDPFMDY